MKKTILLLSGALIAAILLLFTVIFTHTGDSKRGEDVEQGTITLHNVEEVQSNPSIYGQSTLSKADDNDADSPNKVIVNNTDFFQRTTLKSDAWVIFPTFLAEYLENTDAGEQWHVTLVEGSYKDDDNFPYFYCTIEEIPDIKITCNYSVSDGGYFFTCPDLEK